MTNVKTTGKIRLQNQRFGGTPQALLSEETTNRELSLNPLFSLNLLESLAGRTVVIEIDSENNTVQRLTLKVINPDS